MGDVVEVGVRIKTPADLYSAVNTIYENCGAIDKASIVVGTSSIHVITVSSGGPDQTKGPLNVDAFFPTAEQALEATWGYMCLIKVNPKIILSAEVVEDMGEQEAIKPTRIYWRSKPELVETKNKLYAVRMRIALA